MAHRLDITKTVQLLKAIVRGQADIMVGPMMKRFDDEIVPFEDSEDPSRPSRFRSEFKEFLIETVLENIPVKVTSVGKKTQSIEIDVGVGDADKLGFGERLDESTTDGLRLIGTVIQGIAGAYVLVTSKMVGRRVGRFGGAFLMPVRQYRRQAVASGWDPNRSIWSFSNFPGIPDFFQKIDFNNVVTNVTKELAEAIKR
jgi:hypothetical protein